MALLLVMFGGALGAGARFLVGRAAFALAGPDFPYGTLAANLIGGLGMGLLAGVLARSGSLGEQTRLFAGVGLLGGFTTFSSFSLDAVVLYERGAVVLAAGYVLLSVAGSILALFAGLSLVRTLA